MKLTILKHRPDNHNEIKLYHFPKNMNFNDIIDNYTNSSNQDGDESSNSVRNRMNEWAGSFDDEHDADEEE